MSARTSIASNKSIDGLLSFAQNIAVPCLLFINIFQLDLQSIFSWGLLVSFYAGSLLCFISGAIIARVLLKCNSGESIAIGFCALFSNSVIIGLPITELAYGKETLGANFAIISIHAPFCYIIGISAMEFFQNKRSRLSTTIKEILKTVSSNAITLSLFIGLIFNILKIQLLEPIMSALNLISVSAIPVALFALGGVLIRYKPSSQLTKISLIAVLSLLVHPLVTYILAIQYFELKIEIVRSAVITASMAPGINAFLFSNFYQTDRETAAGSVLICTPLTIITTSIWIGILA